MVRDEGAGPVRVLIVDDDPRVRTALRAFLSAHPDIEVIGSASNAAVALILVRALAPTVVVVDVHLPVMNDGLTLLRAITRDLRIPAVAISLENSVRRAALDAGAARFLDKASVPEQLVDALAQSAAIGP